jgi:hypothetical protein
VVIGERREFRLPLRCSEGLEQFGGEEVIVLGVAQPKFFGSGS